MFSENALDLTETRTCCQVKRRQFDSNSRRHSRVSYSPYGLSTSTAESDEGALASESNSKPTGTISEGQFTSFQNVAHDFSDGTFLQPTGTI